MCLYLCKISVPPNNYQTSYTIDTKFWLHIVSYRISPTILTPFLNFESCAQEKYLKFIFSPFNPLSPDGTYKYQKTLNYILIIIRNS